MFFSDGSTELAEVSRRAREAALDIFFALNFKFEISDLKSLNRGTRSRESTREILHWIEVEACYARKGEYLQPIEFALAPSAGLPQLNLNSLKS